MRKLLLGLFIVSTSVSAENFLIKMFNHLIKKPLHSERKSHQDIETSVGSSVKQETPVVTMPTLQSVNDLDERDVILALCEFKGFSSKNGATVKDTQISYDYADVSELGASLTAYIEQQKKGNTPFYLPKEGVSSEVLKESLKIFLANKKNIFEDPADLRALAANALLKALSSEDAKFISKKMQDYVASFQIQSKEPNLDLLIDVLPSDEAKPMFVLSSKQSNGKYKRLCPEKPNGWLDYDIDTALKHLINQDNDKKEAISEANKAEQKIYEEKVKKFEDTRLKFSVINQELSDMILPDPIGLVNSPYGMGYFGYERIYLMQSDKGKALEEQRTAAVKEVIAEDPKLIENLAEARRKYEEEISKLMADAKPKLDTINQNYIDQMAALKNEYENNPDPFIEEHNQRISERKDQAGIGGMGWMPMDSTADKLLGTTTKIENGRVISSIETPVSPSGETYENKLLKSNIKRINPNFQTNHGNNGF